MRPNYTDLSSVEKYELPSETYESLPNSVLAWKKNQKLGRFDPNALSPEDALRKQVEKDQNEISTKGKLCEAGRKTGQYLNKPFSFLYRNCRLRARYHPPLVPAAYSSGNDSLCRTRSVYSDYWTWS